MNYSEIKQIIKDMENSGLAELCIEFPDGTKVSLKNETEKRREMSHTEENIKPIEVEKVQIVQSTKKDENLKIVTSPMVGTFYAKSSPSSDAFVDIGKIVKKGDTLCIIEAMKLMNEIESEYDGEIVEILIKDGEMVDYR